MELKLIEQSDLDNFVASQTHSQILQSFAWGEFQKTVGHQVWRFGIYDLKKIIASASIIQTKLNFNKSYLYCPRGPIFNDQLTDDQKTEALKLILSQARDLTIQTKQSEEIFFRFEPTDNFFSQRLIGPGPTFSQFLNLVNPTKSIQPPDTLILDATKSADELLNAMHPKTRYNIRLAQKHNLQIKESIDFNLAWPIFQQTGKRDRFGLRGQNYYQTMLKTVPNIKLLIAQKDETIIAANLIGYYGDTVTYLHGASTDDQRQVMAPYLLQWQAILQTKAQGYKYYDFHGIAPDNHPNHAWAGITRFKKGFGGQLVCYPGTYDFIYEANWYKLYKIFRKLNRIIH